MRPPPGFIEVPLKAAIGSFFVEFSKFEMQSVGSALRSLSKDVQFVEHAESMLEFDARLKLLQRMAFARGVPSAVMEELEGVLERARKLREHRGEVAAGPRTATLWMPAVAQVEEYAAEAIDLQTRLGAIAEKLQTVNQPRPLS
jgi:hypothetical protein